MPQPGTFVAVVGPSGVGKDSLIAFAREALSGEPAFVFPRRVVTRALEPSEDHIPMPCEEFIRLRERGHFVLEWEAHGLCYGVPQDVAHEVSRGRNVVLNLSRGAVGRMRERFSPSAVIEITASPETLARRLARRGRETAADQDARLKRAIHVAADAAVSNDGSLQDAGHAFLSALRRVTVRQAMVLGL